MSTPKRQFVTDESGMPIAVILPLEDYNRVKDLLELPQDDEKLKLMQEAANDEVFLDDIKETMTAFEHIDNEWWEPTA